MKNTSMMFVKNDTCTSKKETVFVLSVKDSILELKKMSGRDPYIYEVEEAFNLLIHDCVEQDMDMTMSTSFRKSRYRFVAREGISGCVTYFIEYLLDGVEGFPIRKKILHVSMADKVPDFKNVWFYDFCDLMVARDVIKTEQGNYTFNPDEVEEPSLKIIKPRLIQFEEGWTSPHDTPESIVPMAICREAPEDE